MDTRRSYNGLLMLLNNTPRQWYRKSQKTVDTLTYGSELLAMIIDAEVTMTTCYNLIMIGVPIDDSSQILGYNEILATSCYTTSRNINKIIIVLPIIG